MKDWLQNLFNKSNNIRLTIRTKLMAIISILIFLSLGLLSYITTGIFEEDMENIIKLMNSRTSKLLAEKVLSDLDERKTKIHWIYMFQKTGISDSPEGRKIVQKVFSDFKSILLHIACEPSGNSCTPLYKLINQKKINDAELSQKELEKAIKQTIRNSQVALRGGVYIRNISPQFKKPLMLISYPVIEKNNLKAILVNVVDASHFLSLFDIRSGQQGKVRIYNSFMVDQSGHIIIHPEQEFILSDRNFDSHPAVKKMFTSRTRSGLIRYDYNNEDFFGAYAKISNYNIGIITTIKADLALEGVTIAIIRSLLVSLLIMVSSILFIYYFSKTISSPIRKLFFATKEIEKGNFDINLTSSRRDEIGDLTDSFNHMSRGLLERERLKGAFDKFVNKDIANSVLDGDLKLGGERKKVSIFFSDIRSFTAISEKMQPEEVVEFLNEYMTLMVDIIHRFDGNVDKFIGDAIMAVWGTPESSEKDVTNAIDAAIEMRYSLIDYNNKRGKSKPEIKIGAGINTGDVLAGQIGSDDRLEYTVIGDAVNLASRIETLNKPFGTDILISENTFNEVKDIYKTVVMEKIYVKGKSKPQKVFCVLGRKDDSRTPASLAALRKMMKIKKPSGKVSTEEEKKYESIKK